MPNPPQDLNMTREYRAELKQLRADLRIHARASGLNHRIATKALLTAIRDFKARKKATLRDHARRERGLVKDAAATRRRIGILEGRLS